MMHLRQVAASICLAIGLFSGSARADLVSDIKAYAAAADVGDWAAAARAADRILAEPAATLALSDKERMEMLAMAAESAARGGDIRVAVDRYRRIVASIEARDGAKSHALAAPLSRLAELLGEIGSLDEAVALMDRVADLLEAELGLDNPGLLPTYEVRRILERKRLEAAKGQADRVAMIEKRLDEQEAAIEALTAVAKARAAASEREPPRTRGVSDAPFQLVPIHFGTNREPTGKPEPAAYFGDRRGPLLLGVATVSVPRARAIGEVPQPSAWRGEYRPDAAKHFILTKIERSASADAFVASARAQIERSQLKEALVFIHGYNSDFQGSVFRAAQLAVDLGVDGAAFMYSWPSKGSLPGYVADSAQVIRPLTRSLLEFLEIVRTRTGAERIHVVAHSMGNRYLLEALDLMARDVAPSERQPRFLQIVFAAPDVDAEDFADRVKSLNWMARRLTLYASAKDRALQLSSVVNGGYRRAGDATALVTVPGLDTIDTTELGGEGLGHGDFADRALDDFRAVVWLSLQPKLRCVLVDRKNQTGSDYWALTADQTRTCPHDAFRMALSMMRRYGPVEAEKFVREKIESARKANDVVGEGRLSALLTIFANAK